MTPRNPVQAGDPIIATGFREAVLATVAAIPPGRVLGYGEVARRAGYPGRARQVGSVLSRLPVDSGIPWHRVLRANGHIAFPADTRAHQRQRSTLEAEGVQFQGERVAASCFDADPGAGRRAT